MVASVVPQAGSHAAYQSLQIDVELHASVQRRNGDTISITTLDYSASLKIVGENVLGRLNSILEEAGFGSLAAYNLTDFTPEAVSARILNFAQGFLDLAQNDEETTFVLGEIERGISQGLAQARETLEALRVLNGQVRDGVDLTESLLRQGLSRLAQPQERVA